MIKCKECGAQLGMPGRDPTESEQRAFEAHRLHECPANRALSAHVAKLALVCSGCGAQYPQACVRDCPRQPDALGVLLQAVAGGATLILKGKPLLQPADLRHPIPLIGRLESETGAKFCQASGQSIGPVLVELAEKWSLL